MHEKSFQTTFFRIFKVELSSNLSGKQKLQLQLHSSNVLIFHAAHGGAGGWEGDAEGQNKSPRWRGQGLSLLSQLLEKG